jgi:hypothetical protein
MRSRWRGRTGASGHLINLRITSPVGRVKSVEREVWAKCRGEVQGGSGAQRGAGKERRVGTTAGGVEQLTTSKGRSGWSLAVELVKGDR